MVPHVRRYLLSGAEQPRILCFTVGCGKAVERPRRATSPSRIRGKALVRMRENFLTWARVVGNLHVLRRRARRSKRLTVISRVVMDRLNHRTIITYQPGSGLQGVLQTKLPPLGIASLARCPPPDLQVHHRIDDRIVAADAPCGDEFSRGAVELLQTLGRPQSTLAILHVFCLAVSKD